MGGEVTTFPNAQRSGGIEMKTKGRPGGGVGVEVGALMRGCEVCFAPAPLLS